MPAGVEAISQLVAKPIRQINDTQLTTVNGKAELFLVCLHTPIGTPAPGAGSYDVRLIMHGHQIPVPIPPSPIP